jgi:tRNA modification GTPase
MEKTIAALATPSGISGLAVIRLSGDKSIEIIDKIFSGKDKIANSKSHTIRFGKIQSENTIIDSVTISIFKAPNSYTGEDVIEISCHGGLFTVRSILDLLYKSGAEQAEPGEFTRRAFVNGKMDLLQVEAVADIIHSQSAISTEISVKQNEGIFSERLNSFIKQLLEVASKLELENDFADEDVEFTTGDEIKSKIEKVISFCSELSEDYRASEILRSGYHVAIVGYPNAGKSSLFNRLLKKDRAIISEEKGTTRDYLEEPILINNIPVRLFDTAGIREAESSIEIEGIKLSYKMIDSANMILVLNDISESENHSISLFSTLQEKYPSKEIIYVQNKIDLEDIYHTNDEYVYISTNKGSGIETVRNIIYSNASESIEPGRNVLINQRHAGHLNQAIQYLDNAVNEIDIQTGSEIVSFEIRSAIGEMEKLTGERYSEDVLNTIFSGFCIGK